MRYSLPNGFFSIDSMPNQPSVALCYDFTIIPEYRGTKASHQLKAYQMKLLHELHYTVAICTTQASNEAQNKVLQAAGWVITSEFYDIRTGHKVYIWNWHVTKV